MHLKSEIIKDGVDFLHIDIFKDDGEKLGEAHLAILERIKLENGGWRELFKPTPTTLKKNERKEVSAFLDVCDFEGYQKVAYMNSIEIKQCFQGKGFGTEAMKKLLKKLWLFDIEAIYFEPYPLEAKKIENIEEYTKRLIEFYSRFGAEHVESTRYYKIKKTSK